jgi:hypothetical protein
MFSADIFSMSPHLLKSSRMEKKRIVFLDGSGDACGACQGP